MSLFQVYVRPLLTKNPLHQLRPTIIHDKFGWDSLRGDLNRSTSFPSWRGNIDQRKLNAGHDNLVSIVLHSGKESMRMKEDKFIVSFEREIRKS